MVVVESVRCGCWKVEWLTHCGHGYVLISNSASLNMESAPSTFAETKRLHLWGWKVLFDPLIGSDLVDPLFLAYATDDATEPDEDIDRNLQPSSKPVADAYSRRVT
jgi:hypothetical protein